METQPHPDKSVMSPAEPAKSTTTKKGKKTAAAKKSAGKAKGRGIKSAQEESQITSSFLEPEDDNFDIKVGPSPGPTSSSKKRKSEDMDTTGDDQAREVDLHSQMPMKKQRRTRASSSAAKVQNMPIVARAGESEADAQMTDAEEMHPPIVPASKKKGKGGRKRASSTVRKASSASTASKASLRATMPDDEGIETALKADLDRPLTDEEADAESVETEQPKSRRLTRTRPGSKKAAASVAPTRRNTRASSPNTVEPLGNLYPSIPSVPDDELESKGSTNLDDSKAVEAERSPEVKKQNGKRSQKRPVQNQSQDEDIEMSQEAVGSEEKIEQKSVQAARTQPTRNRQISRQLPMRNTRGSTLPATNDNAQQVSDINSSMLETQTVQDDSGHETDVSVVKAGRMKRGGRNAHAPEKKAKGGKRAAPMKPSADEVVQAPELDHETKLSTEQTFDVTPDESGNSDSKATAPMLPEEPVEETQVTKPSKKTKGQAGKTKAAAQKTSIAASPEQSDLVKEGEAAPPPAPPLSIHSTPQPVLSPQSSDAENQPPSSRPSSFRPPLSVQSPSKSQVTKVPIAITPSNSPSKGGFSKLQSTLPWTMVDLEHVFLGTPSTGKENNPFVLGNATSEGGDALASPEKKMTVEEWIQFNAQRGEERLRGECERLVGKFEGEGVRALRTLEGIVCAP